MEVRETKADEAKAGISYQWRRMKTRRENDENEDDGEEEEQDGEESNERLAGPRHRKWRRDAAAAATNAPAEDHEAPPRQLRLRQPRKTWRR